MRLRVGEQLRKWTAEMSPEWDEVGSVRRRISLTELDSRAKVFPLHRKVARFIGDALVSYLLANGWSCKGTGCKFSVEHEQTFFVIADKTECAENG